MQNIIQDIRYALRQFRRSPVFTATALLTLAIGIGGTTAIFTMVNAVMLRSLPVADPDSLYRVGDSSNCCVNGGPQDNWGLFTYALYERIREATPEFAELAAFQAAPGPMSVRRAGNDEPSKPLTGEFVTGNYFKTFGVNSFAGRVLTARDDRAAAAPVAVLSYRAWRQTYGSDPAIIGSTFVIGGHPFTIVGISPPGFYGDTLRSDPPDLWVPLQQEPMMRGSAALLHQKIPAWLRIIGRLKPGTTIAGMPARLTVVIRRYLKDESDYPAAFMPEIIRLLPKQHVNVVPAGSGVGTMKDGYRNSLRILLTVCGLVLLIACANVANLLLARGVAQRANISIRTALGASRTRLIRQMLTESILLSVLGGIAGLVVAYFGARLLLALAFGSTHFIPISADPSLPVLGFAFALSLVTGVLFGTAPAWFASRTDPAEALRGLNRSSGERSSLPQKTLLVMQAALSIVLLAGAGLLTRSVSNLEHQDFGFATEHRLSVAINDPPATLSEDQLRVIYKRLRERLLEIPGVRSAGIAQYSPLTDNWSDLVYPEGSVDVKLDMNQLTSMDRVGVGYLETMGQPILQGRSITEEDNEHSRPVAVVNQTFAKKFFPGKNAIGMHFGLDLLKYSKTYEIVGIVRDAKYTDPEHAARPMFFMPLAQHVNYEEDVMRNIELRSHYMNAAVLQVDPNAGNMTAQIRKAFADVNPDLTILGINPLRKQVDLAFDQQRAVAQLVALFGLIALLLAAVGLYGVTAYTVARRTSEIGIRMALGADKTSVVRLVLRGAFTQVVIGLAIGIPAAIGAGRLIASQLYQVKFWDPVALLLSIVTLGICAFIAAVIPARRAASIDPIKALRTE